METIRQDLMFSQMVGAIAMVVSTLLAMTLSSGLLLSTTSTTPGTATWATTMALCTGTTTISQLVPLFVASGTTICLFDYFLGWERVRGEFFHEKSII
jgi:hypothetical protein